MKDGVCSEKLRDQWGNQGCYQESNKWQWWNRERYVRGKCGGGRSEKGATNSLKIGVKISLTPTTGMNLKRSLSSCRCGRPFGTEEIACTESMKL